LDTDKQQRAEAKRWPADLLLTQMIRLTISKQEHPP